MPRSLSLATLLAACGLAAALPAPADAGADPSTGLLAEGVKATYRSHGNGSGSLKADVLVQHIGVDRERRVLEVRGRIAAPDGGTGGLAPFTSQPFNDTAARLGGGGTAGDSCGVLTLDVGPATLGIRGGLRVDPATVHVPSGRLDGRAGKRLGARLCELGDLLGGDGSLRGLGDLLDQINGLLERNLVTVP